MGIADPLDQTGCGCSVDELDNAVVSQQQVLGHLPDRGRLAVASNGEQQLVLRSGEPDGLCLVLAPVLEAAQPVQDASSRAVPHP